MTPYIAAASFHTQSRTQPDQFNFASAGPEYTWNSHLDNLYVHIFFTGKKIFVDPTQLQK